MYKNKHEYSISDILQFKQSILKELYTFEFKNYKIDNNTIDGV